ncbi:MAG: YdjY domain-containing protein [Planctomycetota bacterium]
MQHRLRTLVALAAAATCASLALTNSTTGQEAPEAALRGLFEGAGIRFEPELGRLSIDGAIATRDDLLEFLLVGPNGSGYESLLRTDVDPTLLNTALLALGLEAGRNARWVYADDGAAVAPPEGQRADKGGRWLEGRDVRLDAPDGDGLLIYVGWSKDGEDFFFRIEDLIGNVEALKPLPRQRWTYIGSRFVPDPDSDGELFLAALEQNLVNIAWFPDGNTLLTSSAPVCERQDIWAGNPWIVPDPGTPVRIVFSRELVHALPEELAAQLPVIPTLEAIEREESSPGEDEEG